MSRLRLNIREQMAMEDNGDPANVFIRPGDGETITNREGREVIVLTAREAITVTDYRIAPGEGGPDLHVHREHTDAFYVLDGELDLTVGAERERVRTGAGGLVAAPPNCIHTFANGSDREVRFLNLHTPDGGFAGFMRARREGDETVTFDTHAPPPDGGLPLSEAIVAGPGEGERRLSGPRVALIKAAIPHMCFAEFEVDGSYEGPSRHSHEVEVDAFYVLEGELEFTVEDSREVVGAGTLASIPPGVAHAFDTVGSTPARFLNIHAPDAGFAEFLRRASD